MNNPIVSIVIATYNYAKYLPAAIDSTLAQTYRDFEIVVVELLQGVGAVHGFFTVEACEARLAKGFHHHQPHHLAVVHQ